MISTIGTGAPESRQAASRGGEGGGRVAARAGEADRMRGEKSREGKADEGRRREERELKLEERDCWGEGGGGREGERPAAATASNGSVWSIRVPRWAACFTSALGYEEASDHHTPSRPPSLGSLASLRSSSFATSFDRLRLSWGTLPQNEPEPSVLEQAVAEAEVSWGAGALSRTAHHAAALRFHALWIAALAILLPDDASNVVRRTTVLAIVPLLLWLRRAARLAREVIDRAQEPLPTRKDHDAADGRAYSTRTAPPHTAPLNAYADAPGHGAEELVGRHETEAMPPLAFWGEPDATSYQLRSASYMSSGIKRPSADAIFSLFALDCFLCEDPSDRYNVIGRSDHWLHAKPRAAGTYTFVLNVIIPSDNNLILVAYFRESSPGLLERSGDAAIELFKKWVQADDRFRSERLKLIPRVAKGPLVIRRGIGAKPVLLGRRISVHYHARPDAFEVDLDVSSDRFADNITRLVRDRMASSVCLDLAVTIEGRDAAELPERILAAVRCDHIDFTRCTVTLPSSKSR